MDIVIGHTNSDLDCLGSLVLSRYLYPSAIRLRSRLLHPVAKKLLHLYSDHIRLAKLSDIRDEPIENIVIVDTRSESRLKEYFQNSAIRNYRGSIEVWDHHPKEDMDFPKAIEHLCNYGANVSLLTKEIIGRNLSVTPEDATIGLIGLYADTGNFTHSNTCAEDFEAAAFFKKMGASLDVVNKFIHKMSDQYQVEIFHTLINQLEPRVIKGHHLLFMTLFLEEQIPGLAAVVEKIQDVENPDASFGIFFFKQGNSTVLIARSRKEEIPVHHILGALGGGGHAMAASALIRGTSVQETRYRLLQELDKKIVPGFCARDLMSREVKTLHPNQSLLEASLFLEKVGHTGAPVVDPDHFLVGILTLRDIQKGRKVQAMKAPVKAYMATHPVFVEESVSLREIEELILRRNIGHLPVTQHGKVVGICTRADIIAVLEHHRKKQAVTLQNMVSAGISPEGTPQYKV